MYKFFLLLIFFLNTSTYSQTLTLQCLGTKTMLLPDGKYRSWENYTQTYIIKDGMIDGKSPEPSVGNLLYYLKYNLFFNKEMDRRQGLMLGNGLKNPKEV